MLWIFAWKNIWRNKIRSLVVILAITIGLAGGLFSSAFMQGMSEQRIRTAIDYEIGHLQIHDSAYMLNKELNDTISNIGNITNKLAGIKQIKAFSERLKITSIAMTANNGSGVTVFGIKPEQEKLVSQIHTAIMDSSGTYFEEDKKNSIVIGKKLAEKLKVKLRSKIVLNFQREDGSLTSSAFKVTGIFKTVNSSYDEMNVFVKYESLNELIGFNGNKMHELVIYGRSELAADTIKAELSKQFKGYSIQTWEQISPELGMMNEMQNQMLYVVMIILLLALSFAIINTMLMAILERTREIGMLMAVGMNKTRVFFMIMLETIMLSLTGGFAGMIISGVLIKIFHVKGIDLSAFSSGLSDMGINSMVYPNLQFTFYINLTVLVIITGVLSSIIPARRALKLKPVEAIRTL